MIAKLHVHEWLSCSASLPDSGILVIRFCAYPGPACDANTPADHMHEMRTYAIRSLERSVGTNWREGAVLGGGVFVGGIGDAGIPGSFITGDTEARRTTMTTTSLTLVHST